MSKQMITNKSAGQFERRVSGAVRRVSKMLTDLGSAVRGVGGGVPQAGGVATLMVQKRWNTTSAALANIAEVQAFLNSTKVGQPLDWTNLPPPTPPPVGTTCALGW
jgi:hypothetical protein